VANHGIPAHRPIEPGEGRDRLKGSRRVKFKAAIAPGYEHAVNPCRLESRHELHWQSPTFLNVASVPRNHRRKRGGPPREGDDSFGPTVTIFTSSSPEKKRYRHKWDRGFESGLLRRGVFKPFGS
jgi:hypothetical protein